MRFKDAGPPKMLFFLPEYLLLSEPLGKLLTILWDSVQSRNPPLFSGLPSPFCALPDLENACVLVPVVSRIEVIHISIYPENV